MLRPLILICCLLAAPTFAATTVLAIKQDRYEAGTSVRFDGPAVTDLFMAGNRVAVVAPVGGSAHLEGRRVTVEAAVAGDLFAAGYGVVVSGAIGGDATVTVALRAPLPASPDAAGLVRFATLAATSHNPQAWRFRAARDTISILPDMIRATPVVDPDNHHLFISLGCAAENLTVVVASRGMPGEVLFDLDTSELSFAHSTGATTDKALSEAIPQRQSTRGMYDGTTLTPTKLGCSARRPAIRLCPIGWRQPWLIGYSKRRATI